MSYKRHTYCPPSSLCNLKDINTSLLFHHIIQNTQIPPSFFTMSYERHQYFPSFYNVNQKTCFHPFSPCHMKDINTSLIFHHIIRDIKTFLLFHMGINTPSSSVTISHERHKYIPSLYHVT